MLGWCADLFRFAWALLYWNCRKTAFRLRLARASESPPRPPCQNASDSGVAHRTGCDACLGWNQPLRFQRVCPLLEVRANGAAVCSVDAAQVRPFWRRAVIWIGGFAVVLYVAGAGGLFGFLRLRGYELSPAVVFWPPAWRTFEAAQGQLFARRGREAYQAGRINEAVLALSIAFERDPRNYEAGFLLASLWQTTQPVMSNRLFLQLIREHPAQRAETAQAWQRVLLGRGEFGTSARLAFDMLAADPSRGAAWVQALIFASRQLHSVAPLQDLLTRLPGLKAEYRQAVELEIRLTGLDAGAARQAILGTPVEADAPFLAYYRIDALIRRGFATEGLALLDQASVLANTRERAGLRLDGFAQQGWNPLVQNDLELLLTPAPRRLLVELACAHLVRYPVKENAEVFFRRLEAQPLSSELANYSGFTALFCLAAMLHDDARCAAYAHALRQIAHAPLTALDALPRYFRGENDDRRLSAYLPAAQPLPSDLMMALHERFGGKATGRSPAETQRTREP